MEQLLGSSITYRVAVEPQQGRKVFTLQTLPACDEPLDDGIGKVAGQPRASSPSAFGPASGCSKSLPAILSSHWISSPGWRR